MHKLHEEMHKHNHRKKQKKGSGQKKDRESRPYVWHRIKHFGVPQSTLSLRATIKGDVAAEALTRTLLTQQYPLYTREIPALILHIKKHGKKARQITDLFPKKGPLHKVFLEMLRGKRGGSPRLETIVSLEDRKPIVWAHASPEVLRAAFGYDSMNEIAEKEQKRFEKNPTLKRHLPFGELKELLEAKGTFSELKPLIETNSERIKDKILKGESDGVMIEKTIPKDHTVGALSG